MCLKSLRRAAGADMQCYGNCRGTHKCAFQIFAAADTVFIARVFSQPETSHARGDSTMGLVSSLKAIAEKTIRGVGAA